MLGRMETLHCIPYQARAPHKVDLYFPCRLSKNPSSSTKGLRLLMEASGATAEDTGSIGASYATMLLLYDSSTSRAENTIFHANHGICMSSEMKWENPTSKEQRMYPLHRHNGEHNTMSL